MKIFKATIEDAAEILALQKLAYLSEAKLYDDYDIPPLTQTLEEMKEEFRNHIFLKTVSGSQIIGTVRAYEENATCYIGRLAVHPEMQNQGLGTDLLKEIETYYKCSRFELFTGSRSDKNIQLYKKLGYRIFKTAKYECGNIEIIFMEKTKEFV